MGDKSKMCIMIKKLLNMENGAMFILFHVLFERPNLFLYLWVYSYWYQYPQKQ